VKCKKGTRSGYEKLGNIKSTNLNLNNYSTASKTVIYHFHNLLTHNRLFVFTLNIKSSSKFANLKSITELFPNANWFEREVSELYNFIFEGKKDTRNLMLQYGDTSVSFQKFLPSIGLKEMFYDSINDLICQTRVTTQI
jgi:NADH:ubiquinone oxidoreductase subunit C